MDPDIDLSLIIVKSKNDLYMLIARLILKDLSLKHATYFKGPQCFCPKGLKLGATGHDCIDVNECEVMDQTI